MSRAYDCPKCEAEWWGGPDALPCPICRTTVVRNPTREIIGRIRDIRDGFMILALRARRAAAVIAGELTE